MKNSILFPLLFIIAIPAISQRTKKTDFEKERFFRVGFKAGVNINKVQGQSFKEQFRYNYSLGGFTQFNFSRKLGLQPELSFVQSSAESTNDMSDVYDDISLNGSQLKAKLNYLKFGSLFNLNVGPTQKVKLQFGPQWGMLLNQKTDSLNSPQNIFKKGDFSLAGGLLLQLPVVHIGGRFEQGLSNINNVDDTHKWKSQAWQIFAGVTF